MAGFAPPVMAPARLFRLLLGRPGEQPYPELPIAYRIPFAAGVGLSVRAAPALVLDRARDDAWFPEAPDVEAARAQRAVVAAVLRRDDGPAFRSAAEVGELAEHFAKPLRNAIGEALDVVCPTFGRADYKAWLEVLKEGAADRTNWHRAHALASCAGRPERFWGIPVGALADGHWFTMHAAIAVTEKKK